MDQTDFEARGEADSGHHAGCLFCELPPDRFEVLDANELCMTLRDSYPVTDGHCLIIPRRHAETWFDMNPAEVEAANQLMHRARARIRAVDASVTGFNFGTNAGKSAGQSVFHAHVHFIPRRDGDQQDPQGGVRKIFPDKAKYRRV
jgi:diadenosine tetraphosphate (Ap4A) HIT family hydrolase